MYLNAPQRENFTNEDLSLNVVTIVNAKC